MLLAAAHPGALLLPGAIFPAALLVTASGLPCKAPALGSSPGGAKNTPRDRAGTPCSAALSSKALLPQPRASLVLSVCCVPALLWCCLQKATARCAPMGGPEPPCPSQGGFPPLPPPPRRRRCWRGQNVLRGLRINSAGTHPAPGKQLFLHHLPAVRVGGPRGGSSGGDGVLQLGYGWVCSPVC